MFTVSKETLMQFKGSKIADLVDSKDDVVVFDTKTSPEFFCKMLTFLETGIID